MRIQVGGMAVNLAAKFLLLPRLGVIAGPLSTVFTHLAMIAAILARVTGYSWSGRAGSVQLVAAVALIDS